MPARQPFTALCQMAARGSHAGRADLHLHTTYSDGTYTPFQVIDLAKRCGLGAVAVTDHDTLGGVLVAQKAAGSALEVVPGVEITAEYQDRELHLLAYFVALDHAPLNAALDRICRQRVERFQEMIERLRHCGVSVATEVPSAGPGPQAVGRRHLAELLVGTGRVTSVREAFSRYLGDNGRVVVPKYRLPVGEALALVQGAGGVAAWAHPPYDCDQERLAELRSWGLRALEVEYPDTRPSRTRQLRSWAQELGLAVTGGSDCHGPGRRPVGARTVSLEELDRLRQMA
jgi:predicted metal-dependent phosphoesterase TrpH